jgi:hypothetical protein
MAAICPELCAAASWLSARVALGLAAALAALVPGFTFSYLRAGPRRGCPGWSLAARRGDAGAAAIVLLLACQVAAVAWLDLLRDGPCPASGRRSPTPFWSPSTKPGSRSPRRWRA